MEITDIRIRRINDIGKMKAVASVTFDDVFVVHDMKVIDNGAGELFVVMPSRRVPSGEFKDIAHPLNTQTRHWLQSAVLEAFAQLPDSEQQSASSSE